MQSAGTTADGVTYLISAPVEGELLSEYLLRRGPLPEAEALALVLQVGEALSGVSQAGAFVRLFDAQHLCGACRQGPCAGGSSCVRLARSHSLPRT